MTDQFVGEIRLVGFNFPPQGWAVCAGQLLPISQNTALFSLLGTFYGGDGKTTFALPNLQGVTAIGAGMGGEGPLTPLFTGETGGEEAVQLTESQLPQHSHTVMAVDARGATGVPTGNSFAIPRFGRTSEAAYSSTTGTIALAPNAFAPAGNSVPHSNMQPYLALNYVIALQGIYPSRA